MKTNTVLKIVILCVICAAMAGCIDNITKSEYPISLTITHERAGAPPYVLVLLEDGSVASVSGTTLVDMGNTWEYTGESNGSKLYTMHRAWSPTFSDQPKHCVLRRDGTVTITTPFIHLHPSYPINPDKVETGTWKRGLP